MPDRAPDKLPYGRRRRTAASALVAILVAFALGCLFNAPAMKKTAEQLPFGPQRSFRLALVDPVATVSHWLLLDRPARLTAAALGKPNPGPAPMPTLVAATPRPRPSKGGKPAALGGPLPRPSRGKPLKLLIAGDSMMGIPGMALVNLAQGSHVMRSRLDYRISSGLTRPDFFDWPAELARQVHAQHPGAAIVMFGANDRQGVQTPSGKVYFFETGGWKKEYRRRVQQAIDILQDGRVRRIYWVGQPIMPDATFSRQLRVLNDIYRQMAAKNPGVEYIDAYKLFSTAGGAYSAYLRDDKGILQQVREADGEHLTYAGGLRLARVLLAAIKADWLPRKRASATPSPKASPTKLP